MASNFTKNVISAIDIKNVKYNIKAIPFHATEAEWNSISYIPKQGEFIVYDVDNNNTSPRFKTGDGVTDVKILPFTLATISEVQTYVNSQIGSAGHLKRIILEEGAELPDISEADADTIYMKRSNESRLVSDVFDEYMAINGAWEIIGNTKVDLSNYITQEQLNEEITEWVGDTVVSEQISTAINSHNASSVAHSSIREKALCVQELPYLISGTVNDLHIHPSVIYGNGKYMAIDMTSWNIRTSVDGINWEASATVPVMGNYHAGIYGNGKYVFISMNNELGYPITLYSEDAINWNYNKIEFTFNGEVISPEVWDKIVFENGIFILSGDAPFIIYSEDAISWTCSNEFLYNGTQLGPHTICYGNGKYVAFSQHPVSNILPVFTSTDAITWTANEIDLSLLSQEILEVLYPTPRNEYNYNMIYANSTFVAIFGEKVTATSTDGVNWNFAANLPCRGAWKNVTYRNGTFVTVTDNNELGKSIAAYSTDGTTWNIADKFGNPLKVEWLHLISGEDKFLITSENGQLAYSSDGINWTYAIKNITTLFSEEKTSDLKEVLGVGDPIYVAEESTDTSAEVINADTLGGYSASDFRRSDWMPSASDVGARANTWLPTAAEIGAAPSGYGFGGQAIGLSSALLRSETELDEVLETLYSEMGNSESKLIRFAGYPDNSDYNWYGFLFKSSANYGSLIIQSAYGKGSLISKAKYYGTWKPLEWVNPPMIIDEEYRTTERYNGKPVYVKAVDFGAVPNGSSASVSHEAANVENILSCTGTLSNGTTIPYNNMSCAATKGLIYIYSTTSSVSYTAVMTIKYTKTTD